MASQLLPALLLAFAASAAVGDDISATNTKQLVEALGVMDDTVAYLSSVDDPRLMCLTSVVTVYEPEKHFGVYLYQYKGQNGEPGFDINYCVNLTATESFKFGFAPCEDDAFDSASQGYYFNGENCFVGQFPLLGNNSAHRRCVAKGTFPLAPSFGATCIISKLCDCLLWVKRGFKDSVPEECVAQFDENCGPNSFTLYDKERCS